MQLATLLNGSENASSSIKFCYNSLANNKAAWPSGKAEDCKSFIPSSNLGAAFCLIIVTTQIEESEEEVVERTRQRENRRDCDFVYARWRKRNEIVCCLLRLRMKKIIENILHKYRISRVYILNKVI